MAAKALKPTKGANLRIVDGVKFVCPFCGAEVSAGTTACNNDVVIHAQPTCKTFDELGPLEFIQKARRFYYKEEPS